MDRIDLNKYFYHGFWFDGEGPYDHEVCDDIAIKKLESIFSSGYLYCYDDMKKIK